MIIELLGIAANVGRMDSILVLAKEWYEPTFENVVLIAAGLLTSEAES